MNKMPNLSDEEISVGCFYRFSPKKIYLLAFGLVITTINSIFLNSIFFSPSSFGQDSDRNSEFFFPSDFAQDSDRNSEQILGQSQFSSTLFSDLGINFWASPFIQALVERNVITGFPDGTFRPNQPVKRAEFATMLQKAFNQNPVRQLNPGGFADVPTNYWASSAIREAYETGFMSGYPGNLFEPNQEILKVQAIVALTNGLGLIREDASNDILATYYSDAFSIPNYATNSVFAATKANMVVNYPDVGVLNPVGILTRAETAALIYQALVTQGQIQPLASNIPAASYVVAGTPDSNSNNNDIVSIASSSNSFSILTSLLKSAGLANILQQPGPYTIFAPTNEAFAALPPDVVEQLRQPKNKEVLMSILKYHVVPGELAANQISGGKLQTFEGEPIQVQVDSNSNQIVVNNTSVIQTDIKASNGVIHAVNQVLIPPDLGGPDKPKTDVEIGNAENNGDNNTDSGDVKPGRATRGGSSYIGVGANIGLEGDTELGETNFAVISKIGLTKSLSVRPAAVIGDDTVFLLPLTLDFSPRKTPSVAGKSVGISPYLGAGVAVEAGDDTDVGLLVTGGVDVPLGSRFTINGSANAAFLDDDTDVGLMFGIGYNF